MNIRRLVLAVAIAVPALAGAEAGWTGVKTGAATYTAAGNWAGGTVDNNFSGVNLTGNLILTLAANVSATTGMNFNYGGDEPFNMTLQPDSGANRTITLGGNVSFEPSGTGRTLTIRKAGSPERAIPINFGGADRTFTVSEGNTLNKAAGSGTMVGGGFKLTKAGGGVLEIGVGTANNFNLQVDAGEFRYGGVSVMGGDGKTITINNNALVNLQSQYEQYNTSLVLNGGTLEGTGVGLSSVVFKTSGITSAGGGNVNFTGTGQFFLNGNVTYSDGAADKSLVFASTEVGLGGSARTFTVANGLQDIDVDVTAKISNGGVTKAGAGVMRLGGANTYTGATIASAGVLLVDGSTMAGSAVSVASGAALGGAGTVNGSLTLSNGALVAFDFAANTPLTLGESSIFALDSTFGVASLRDRVGTAIDWNSVANGTYTLIAGGNLSPTFFDATKIRNFGPTNAADIGGGRAAWFTNGSLALVVSVPVPEPSAVLLGGVGLVVAGWVVRRRWRGIGRR